MNHRNDSCPHYVLATRKVSCRYISDIHERAGAQYRRSIVTFVKDTFIQTRPVQKSFQFGRLPVENYDVTCSRQSQGVTDFRKGVVVGMDKIDVTDLPPLTLLGIVVAQQNPACSAYILKRLLHSSFINSALLRRGPDGFEQPSPNSQCRYQER